MPLKIAKPADKRFVKSLMFSPPGHGKTTFLGTAQADERTAPMLLLDFEGGDESLTGLDIDVAEIRSWSDYNEAYEILSDPDCDYKSLGIDSISETNTWALLDRSAELAAKRNEPDLIQMDDYNIVGTQIRRLLREFRDLPMHVFYTAQAKEIEERGVGKVQVPKMTGQLSDEVAALVGVVGYLALTEDDEGDTERLLLLQNYRGYRIKARTPWGVQAPDEIEAPTITSLLDALDVKELKKRSTRKTTTKEDE